VAILGLLDCAVVVEWFIVENVVESGTQADALTTSTTSLHGPGGPREAPAGLVPLQLLATPQICMLLPSDRKHSDVVS